MERRTAFGVLTGFVLSLAVALIIALAANGRNNPGVPPDTPLVLQSAAGGASIPTPARDSPFDGLDMDGDGKLSLAEAAGYSDIVTRFHRVDRNKDGRLTIAEFD